MAMTQQEIQRALFLSKPEQRQAVMGAYDGASREDPSYDSWRPIIGSPDPQILSEKDLLDGRTGDIVRNDSYLQSAQTLTKDSIIGSEYILDAHPNIKMLGLSENWLEEFQDEVHAKFGSWANSPDNWVDSTRQNTFTELLRMAVGIFFATGEVFAVAEYHRDIHSPYATRIQMIENSRVEIPYFIGTDDEKVRKGIEYDIHGAPVAYHIREARRGHSERYYSALKHKRIATYNKIGRQQVFHIFEQGYPNQTRGISKIVASIKEIKMGRTFKDIVLKAAAVNASHAAFIKSELPTEVIMQMINTPNSTGLADYTDNYMQTIGAYTKGAKGHKIDGVNIPHLIPGTEFISQQIGNHHGIGDDFDNGLLQSVASGLGISLEEYTRNFSNTNYSSARAAGVLTHKGMSSTKKMVADRLASGIYRLWLEEAMQRGDIETMTSRKVPNFYDRGMKDAYCDSSWIGSSRGQIDELKETQAAVLRIKSGLSTFKQEQSRLGLVGGNVFDTLSKEWDTIKAKEIPIMEDKGMNAVEGGAGASEGRESNEEQGAGKKTKGKKDVT